jgi:hypothetical protein
MIWTNRCINTQIYLNLLKKIKNAVILMINYLIYNTNLWSIALLVSKKKWFSEVGEDLEICTLSQYAKIAQSAKL